MHRIRRCISLAALVRASRPTSPEEAKAPMFAGSFAVSALDFLGGQTSRLCPNCPVSWRNILITRFDPEPKVGQLSMSAIAFHENACGCQVNSDFVFVFCLPEIHLSS